LPELVINASNVISSLCYSLLRIEPYTTCEYRCTCCYARWYYRWGFEQAKPRIIALRVFKKVARRIAREGLRPIPMRPSTLVEPFQAVEEETKLSLKILRCALDHEYPVIVNMKSSLLAKDPWRKVIESLDDRGLLILQISISTLNPVKSRLIEPNASSPNERLRVAKQLYKYALALVKASKSNGGSKPIIKRMSIRLDRYDARIDLQNMVVEIVIREKRYRLRILHDPSYIKKFMGRKWYEVVVKYENGSLWVSIPFEYEYKPYRPRNVIAIDINLKTLTVFDGRKVRRIDTRFIEALSLKAYAEELQRKYPKRWRYNYRILSRIRSLHRRARNIVIDWCRKIAKYIVLKVRKTRSAIVLEDLEKLWQMRSQSNSKLAWRLSRFSYRKLQLAIVTKAIEHQVPIIFVDPRNASKTCPGCGSELRYFYRLALCPVCGYKRDRDCVGAINIYLRALKGMRGVYGCSPSALPMKDETRQRERTMNEGMKVYQLT